MTSSATPHALVTVLRTAALFALCSCARHHELATHDAGVQDAGAHDMDMARDLSLQDHGRPEPDMGTSTCDVLYGEDRYFLEQGTISIDGYSCFWEVGVRVSAAQTGLIHDAFPTWECAPCRDEDGVVCCVTGYEPIDVARMQRFCDVDEALGGARWLCGQLSL